MTMDLEKYILLLVIFFLEDGETGGHGEKHHDHVRLHVPEFIHHDHHTKVITIHHHHHKPKKEHHHHHHHHHKPHMPHGHHHYHHKKAHVSTHTVSKGHGHGHHKHGHHGHHHKHGHHGHKSHHGHGHGHGHGHHHHDTPSYDPPTISYDDYTPSYSPAIPSVIPSYGAGIGHHVPQVHGITHTVKQVKVFDSHPGGIPAGNNGYEVTEQGEEGDDDFFTSVNNLQQNYPATYGYLRGATQQTHDPFAELTPQSAVQTNNHNPFAGAVPQQTISLANGESFPGTVQSDPFASGKNPGLNAIQPSEFPSAFQGEGFDEQGTAFAGGAGDGTTYFSNDENTIVAEEPVSFSREAGIQQTTKTGGIETLVY